MISRLVSFALGLLLVLLLGWPTSATLLEALKSEDSSNGLANAPLVPITSAESEGATHRQLSLFINSVKLVSLTELIAFPIAIPLAFLVFRTNVRGRRGILFLIILAALVPLPLHATSWIGGFGNLGRSQALGARPLIAGLPGAAFVHAMALLPLMVLILGVGFRGVETELEEFALLHLPAWRVLLTVTLRRSLGAILAAALSAAVLTAGDMTVTDLLQVRTYAEEAYLQYQLGRGPAFASFVALPPLLLLGTLLFLSMRKLLQAEPERVLSWVRPEAKTWSLGRLRMPLSLAVFAVASVIFLVPLASLVWRAGRVGGQAALGVAPSWSWTGFLGTLRRATLDVGGSVLDDPIRSALVSGRWQDLSEGGPWVGRLRGSPLLESAVWGGLGAFVAVVLAGGLAWKCREAGRWRVLSAGCIALTLATPGPVAGMALVLAYHKVPLIYDTPLILVCAFALRTYPYAFLILWPSVRLFPREPLESAIVDGAGEWMRIRRVVYPAARSALAAAAGVTFVLAMGELPAVNLALPPGETLLAVEIWSLLHTGVESHLAGVALISLATMSAGGFLCSKLLSRLGQE